MRSSVAESRPSGKIETRSSNTLPRPEFRIPDPQRLSAQPATRKPPQHHLSLTPSEGWLSMLLLTIAVYSVVFSIISANWVSHSHILLLSTAIGLLSGLCIAKIQRFPQAILHLAAVLVGHWLSIWLTSVFAFHISWLLLLENLRSVISGVFVAGASSNTEMVFLFYLTFLSFFLGYFGAWLIYRAHLPWLVALVYCAIMLVNLNYIQQDLSYLVIIMLGALILLVARIQLVNQLTQWTHEGLHTDRVWLQDISRRFVQIGSLFMLLTLFIGWILPSVAQPASGANLWNNLDNLWANITHGQLSLSSPGSLFQPFQPPANFFGDQLSITGDVSLPAGEVLYYTSTATPRSQYLEGFTYDHFDGHTWTSTSNESQQFDANTQLPVDTVGNFNQATTTVTIVLPPEGTKHYLFAPAQPASFNVPTTIYGNGITTAWTQQAPLTQAESYQVTSFISAATARDLSTVPFPRDNPSLWSNNSNMQPYLQTPTDLPPSVHNTLQQWTRGSTSVYDAIKKLESNLSDPAQFKYSVTNPPVPANIDVVAWLLQTHQGYCTYYASAMTIMARMLGIPARVVNGFSQGHFDSQHKVWVVNGEDAHSWVQVYFPGFGWINFDPTPGFSANSGPTAQPSPPPVKTQPTTRPTPIATAGNQKPGSQHAPKPGSTGAGTNTALSDAVTRQNLFLTLSLATLFGSLVVFAFALFVTYKDSKLKANTHIAVSSAIFRRVCRLGSLIGSPPQLWQTPYEYYRMLSRRFPRVAAPLRRVTELFVRERWAAPHQVPGPAEEQALEKLWPHIRNTLIRSLFANWYTKMKL
jgi:transglutaminase-like putative cysteine protease